METTRVKFQTDGGPWIRHNMPCAVNFDDELAVFDMDNNKFQPSWAAQNDGWMLINAKGWRVAFIRFLANYAPLKPNE